MNAASTFVILPSPHQLSCYRVHRRIVIVRREQMPVTIHRHLKATMAGEGLYIYRPQIVTIKPGF